MNNVLRLSLALLLTAHLTQAQTTATSFAALNGQAMSAYHDKRYAESGKLFDQAFQDKAGKPTATDYYNAACAWALAGNKDKAFRYLDQATQAGWDNVAHVKQDTDLDGLHPDKRWQPMLTRLETTVAQAEAKLNQPLKKELDEIYALDQGVRAKVGPTQEKYGMKSAEWEALMKEMQEIDARNLPRVTAMIDRYGWPGKSLVGRMGSMTAFLVIQHSDLATQQKYLPLMREAAAKGELAKANLALVEDRVLVFQNKPQIYGSQLRTDPATGKPQFFPIDDEAHVDARRASMGLGPLADYARQFGLEYQPPRK